MFYKSLQSELLMRIELATSSLPRKCSTTELQQQVQELAARLPAFVFCSFQSGRRDSNPRPSAWKANALSTELLPQIYLRFNHLQFTIELRRIPVFQLYI